MKWRTWGGVEGIRYGFIPCSFIVSCVTSFIDISVFLWKISVGFPCQPCWKRCAGCALLQARCVQLCNAAVGSQHWAAFVGQGRPLERIRAWLCCPGPPGISFDKSLNPPPVFPCIRCAHRLLSVSLGCGSDCIFHTFSRGQLSALFVQQVAQPGPLLVLRSSPMMWGCWAGRAGTPQPSQPCLRSASSYRALFPGEAPGRTCTSHLTWKSLLCWCCLIYSWHVRAGLGEEQMPAQAADAPWVTAVENEPFCMAWKDVTQNTTRFPWVSSESPKAWLHFWQRFVFWQVKQCIAAFAAFEVSTGVQALFFAKFLSTYKPSTTVCSFLGNCFHFCLQVTWPSEQGR